MFLECVGSLGNILRAYEMQGPAHDGDRFEVFYTLPGRYL